MTGNERREGEEEWRENTEMKKSRRGGEEGEGRRKRKREDEEEDERERLMVKGKEAFKGKEAKGTRRNLIEF